MIQLFHYRRLGERLRVVKDGGDDNNSNGNGNGDDDDDDDEMQSEGNNRGRTNMLC